MPECFKTFKHSWIVVCELNDQKKKKSDYAQYGFPHFNHFLNATKIRKEFS